MPRHLALFEDIRMRFGNVRVCSWIISGLLHLNATALCTPQVILPYAEWKVKETTCEERIRIVIWPCCNERIKPWSLSFRILFNVHLSQKNRTSFHIVCVYWGTWKVLHQLVVLVFIEAILGFYCKGKDNKNQFFFRQHVISLIQQTSLTCIQSSLFLISFKKQVELEYSYFKDFTWDWFSDMIAWNVVPKCHFSKHADFT